MTPGIRPYALCATLKRTSLRVSEHCSERHYLLGGASRRLGASLNHLPDWLTGEHGPGPGGPRVVRFIAMFAHTVVNDSLTLSYT